MSHYTLILLGAFHLAIEGEATVELPANKTGALLAYLALESATHQEVGRPRRHLAGLFWPDIDEKYALQSLRNALYNLRQLLQNAASTPDEDFLTVTRQAVGLDGRIEVDALRFQGLLTEVAQHPHPELNQCIRCEEKLVEALKLYRGELLTGLSLEDTPAFEEWLLLWREFLHQQVLVATSQLVEIYEARGALRAAHSYASKLVALDEYREESHRALMRILAGQGLPEQALSHFERLRLLLRDELNAKPSPETSALAQQIAAGEFVAPKRAQKLDASPAAPAIAPVAQKSVAPEEAPSEIFAPAAAGSTGSPGSPVALSPTLDLHDVPEPGSFFGRAPERRQLAQWLLQERTRVVAILGLGGMGKTTLAAHCVRALAAEPRADSFDAIYWRSLVNAPPLAELLPPLLQNLSDQQLFEQPTHLDEQLRLLMQYLRQRRLLLVLDNVESILDSERAGAYRVGYEPYGQLIQQAATLEHQSCLLLTSRERPRGYARWERDGAHVKSLQLVGLDGDAGRQLLMRRGVHGDDATEAMLIARYSGNPLALKLVADTVDGIFAGNIAEFLQEETLIFDDIRAVLDQHFARLTDLEQQILFWLAVAREPMSPLALRQSLLRTPAQRDFLETLRNLQRRSLIEGVGADFALQNVVTEYLTERLIEMAAAEIESDILHRLLQQALLIAQAKDYVRESQTRLILHPIGEQLIDRMGATGLQAKIKQILHNLRVNTPQARHYAGGNLLNLLLALEIDVQGYDFANLSIWQAHLQEATLPNVNFRGAHFANTLFVDNFGGMTALALDPHNIRLASAAGGDALIRLWGVQ
ncbi:MAG: BTAD domain-containing putative transcriptional regulator [Caldilineaceae bacterium]